MRLEDFHIKRCVVCNKIVWRELDVMILYCFDKVDKVIHDKCLDEFERRWCKMKE